MCRVMVTQSSFLNDVKFTIGEFFNSNDAKCVFANEAQLQLKLALFLQSKSFRVEPEYKIPYEIISEFATKENTTTPISYPWQSDIYVDLIVERDGQFVLIELKYLTASLESSIPIFGEQKLVKELTSNMAAVNENSYSCWKDVRRIEFLTKYFKNVVGGFSVIVTNESAYIDGVKIKNANYHEFTVSKNQGTSRRWTIKTPDGGVQYNPNKKSDLLSFAVSKIYNINNDNWKEFFSSNKYIQNPRASTEQNKKSRQCKDTSKFYYTIIEIK